MLYTFLMDWNGGTFISQTHSNSLHEAIVSWSHSLDLTTIGANRESTAKFQEDIESDSPVLIDGLTSVWCICCRIEDLLAVIHIVGTNRACMESQ